MMMSEKELFSVPLEAQDQEAWPSDEKLLRDLGNIREFSLARASKKEVDKFRGIVGELV